MSEKYKNLKVKELQELLQKNGLPHSGKKEELIERLVKHDEQAQEFASLEEEFGDLEDFDESKIDLDDLPDPIKGVDAFDSTEIETLIETTEAEKKTNAKDTTKSATIVSEKTQAEPKPTEASAAKPDSNFKFTPVTFDKKPATQAKPVLPIVQPTVENVPAGAKTSDDAEKALERAKRFGIQLNEKAKQDIRAQRFGISKPSPSKNNTKTAKGGIDPEVLKTRAERFGINNVTAGKGSNGKVPVKLDAAEEEKKRKRAERFNVEANKKQKAE